MYGAKYNTVFNDKKKYLKLLEICSRLSQAVPTASPGGAEFIITPLPLKLFVKGSSVNFSEEYCIWGGCVSCK